MIARFFFDALLDILTVLIGLLPDVQLVLPRYQLVVQWPSWVPVAPVVATTAVVIAWLIVLGAYAVFSWIWRHIPQIAGFGTGNG